MAGPVNLKAVAEKAGVSLATASRVISRSDYPVREELRERVLAAAAELDYVPNAQARGLLQGNPKTVGVLVPAMGPHVNTFLQTLHERLDPYGFLITTITTAADLDQTVSAVTTLQAHRTGTVIFADGGAPLSLGSERLIQRVKSMQAAGHSIVLIAEESQLDVPLVKVPYSRVGSLVADWLKENGHREVAFLADDTRYVGTVRQGTSFLEHAEAAGLTVHQRAGSGQSREAGRELTSALLDEHPEITAVVGEVDALAIGALQAAKARGMDVPGELSVIGAYDVPEAADFDLTSVAISQADCARLALRVARQIREKNLPDEGPAAEVEAVLVERGSTAPARAQ